MASFDDLAFTRSSTGAAAEELFCRDCNEVPRATTTDGKRCIVCGCELKRREEIALGHGTSETMLDQAAASVQELQTVVMRLLSQIGGDWDGVDTGTRRPASDEAVRNLGSFVADQAATIEVAVIVDGIKGEVVAIPANFGPCASIEKRSVIIADPFDGANSFRNADSMKDKIVVMSRGGCPFARKVLRAQAAEAAGVIIIQTVDVWPYTMTDSTGESENVKIPAFMISSKHGKGFVEYLRGEHNEGVFADIVVRKDALECVICQVEMSIGMEVTRMPCQHMFHTACLHEWLQVGNSCPICRVTIAAKRTGHNDLSTGLSAQQRGDFAWSEWFS
ncbi:unnamed protein product [Hyaloperonospora brassicae]|uniref:RING-type E3 ubiquitin transferase n=1 Tax=Hyaloperonospora brassicae TaxID=162125 RepID=A0AAV0SZF8_HYABA|nr:unnamed protein product [Hyaloperonospora brassicae]